MACEQAVDSTGSRLDGLPAKGRGRGHEHRARRLKRVTPAAMAGVNGCVVADSVHFAVVLATFELLSARTQYVGRVQLKEQWPAGIGQVFASSAGH